MLLKIIKKKTAENFAEFVSGKAKAYIFTQTSVDDPDFKTFLDIRNHN